MKRRLLIRPSWRRSGQSSQLCAARWQGLLERFERQPGFFESAVKLRSQNVSERAQLVDVLTDDSKLCAVESHDRVSGGEAVGRIRGNIPLSPSSPQIVESFVHGCDAVSMTRLRYGATRVVAVAVLAGLVLPAAAGAQRSPTVAERAEIRGALALTLAFAPPTCYTPLIRVSTVDRRYAYARPRWKTTAACLRFAGDGHVIFRLSTHWRALLQGSECEGGRRVPRAVMQDLCG